MALSPQRHASVAVVSARYSPIGRAYQRYVEACTGWRRLICQTMPLPNPCRIGFLMPMLLTTRVSESLGLISGWRRAGRNGVCSIGI